MKIAIFSDIHANLTALKAVLDHCFIKYGKDIPIIHLGDCIDYGMRPNDVIGVLSKLSSQMIANVEGNHEIALFGKKVERFSSERGVKANIYTKSILTDTSFSFIKEMKKSPCEMCIDNKMFLFVHGDLSEPHWGKMNIDEKKSSIYENYDYVISGHTHVSSLFYEINKNKCKKTIFQQTIQSHQLTIITFH